MPEFNSFLSVAVPQTLVTSDRKRIAEQIITILKRNKPGLEFKKINCLDVGSSSGEISSYLCKMVKKIICLDVDRNALAIGRRKFANIRNLKFVEFDGVNIPYRNISFDLIILRRVIEVTEYPEKLMAEIFRVMKSQGLVYFESQNFIWPDPNWDWFAFVPAKIKRVFALALKKKHYYFATYRNYWQLKKLFRKFHINMITPLILKNPKKYNFIRLKPLHPLGNFVPISFLKLLEPFLPDFIWVLRKSYRNKPVFMGVQVNRCRIGSTY